MKLSKIITVLLFAAAAIIFIYGLPVARDYKYVKIHPVLQFSCDEEEKLYKFIEKNLTADNGGIKTNYLDKPAQGDLPGGSEILSESLGLTMQYALEAESQTLFERNYLFLNEVFLTRNGLVFWKVQADNKEGSFTNALVDDLRICHALLSAYEKWRVEKYRDKALAISKMMIKYNVKNSLPVDFYDFSRKRSSDSLTLTGIDLPAMSKLSEYDREWVPLYKATEQIVNSGLAAESGIFYLKRYNVSAGKYENERNVNTAEQLILAESLMRLGMRNGKLLEWLKESYSWYGYIVNEYEISGNKEASKNESPAVYALCERIFLLAGDRETAEKFHSKVVKYYLVSDDMSRFYGGYAVPSKEESCSFDNLQALLTLRYKNNQKN